ncbi:endonuclease (plasmid) [Pedobacter sp. BS3]|uniref:endonuclease/exonuclease/phosphatase family protein n=1 Tax=Pedobacter sp. BS3 TaxID=2567937 RepID=UPI0011EFB512|nr:endonuclease/exonuclease/phosphatase family protein [Pedobacter sp. BS3]TZF86025.1 endonuclease [Pedobacter sp. BS3]
MKSVLGNTIKLTVILLLTCACNKAKEAPKDPVKPPVNKGLIVKVMSYNIHIGNPPSKPANYRDLSAIASVINIEKPDLVALSEVDNKTQRSGVTVDQAKELGKLTGMYYFFTKAMDYQGGEYGDAVLSRFPILESTRYVLPTTGSGFEPRSVAMITVEKEGRKFHFAATHLDHTAEDANRILQANELVKIINQLSIPLIIAGDWNAQPSSQPIEILKQTLTPTCVNNCLLTFPATKPDRTIDYIMYKPLEKFKVLNLRTVNETYASDHLPLTAEIELKF